MTDHAEALAKALEAPITRPLRDDGAPEWQQIIALFERFRLPPPPVPLRDELAIMLAWARYGEALAAYRSRPAAEVVELWDRHSNAALEAAATITALRDRVAEVEREADFQRRRANRAEEGWRLDIVSWGAAEARSTAAEAAIARLRDEVIEECASLIDKSQIADTSAGQVVDPRSEGNRSGLAYADALRALKSNRDTHHETR